MTAIRIPSGANSQALLSPGGGGVDRFAATGFDAPWTTCAEPGAGIHWSTSHFERPLRVLLVASQK